MPAISPLISLSAFSGGFLGGADRGHGHDSKSYATALRAHRQVIGAPTAHTSTVGKVHAGALLPRKGLSVAGPGNNPDSPAGHHVLVGLNVERPALQDLGCAGVCDHQHQLAKLARLQPLCAGRESDLLTLCLASRTCHSLRGAWHTFGLGQKGCQVFVEALVLTDPQHDPIFLLLLEVI